MLMMASSFLLCMISFYSESSSHDFKHNRRILNPKIMKKKKNSLEVELKNSVT